MGRACSMPITTQLLAPLAAQGRVRGTCTQVPVQMLILGQLCMKKTGPLCALCMAPCGTTLAGQIHQEFMSLHKT